MATATVDALNVHAESHDDLIIAIGTCIVLDSHLHGLVRNLDHLEVVLHLLLEQLVVQNHDASRLDGAQNVVVALFSPNLCPNICPNFVLHSTLVYFVQNKN